MHKDRALRRRNGKEQWQMLLGFWRHFLWRKGTAASWKPFCWCSEVNYREACASWYWCWSYGLAQVYLSGEVICQADTLSSIKRSKLQESHFYVANRIDSLDSLNAASSNWGKNYYRGKKNTQHHRHHHQKQNQPQVTEMKHCEHSAVEIMSDCNTKIVHELLAT